MSRLVRCTRPACMLGAGGMPKMFSMGFPRASCTGAHSISTLIQHIKTPRRFGLDDGSPRRASIIHPAAGRIHATPGRCRDTPTATWHCDRTVGFGRTSND